MADCALVAKLSLYLAYEAASGSITRFVIILNATPIDAVIASS